jgi:hypothetical protein
MNLLLSEKASCQKKPSFKAAGCLAFPKTPPIFAIPNGNNTTGD